MNYKGEIERGQERPKTEIKTNRRASIETDVNEYRRTEADRAERDTDNKNNTHTQIKTQIYKKRYHRDRGRLRIERDIERQKEIYRDKCTVNKES